MSDCEDITPQDLIDSIEDPNVCAMLETMFDDMVLNDVLVNLVRGEGVQYYLKDEGPQDYTVSGYFVANQHVPPRYGLAISDDPLWLATAVHEYCHFKQWRNDPKLWQSQMFSEPGRPMYDVYDVLHEWSQGRRSLTYEQVKLYSRIARDIELDCEKNTVRLLRFNDIESINLDEYTQKANAYVFSYSMLPLFGHQWHTSPYAQSCKFWRMLPTTFDLDYDVEWQNWVEQYYKHCFA